MRTLFLCLIFIVTLVAAPALAQDDPIEAQRCIWRCLANSNGAEYPAYQACITNICDAGGAAAPNQSGAARWDYSQNPADNYHSVVGCSDASSDNWTCLAVRCDGVNQLGLYFDMSEGGVVGTFSLDIDGARFPVTPGDPRGTVFAYSLAGDINAIAGAMKRGRQVRLVDTNPPLNPGFDVIHLRGSGKAIGSVQSGCTPP